MGLNIILQQQMDLTMEKIFMLPWDYAMKMKRLNYSDYVHRDLIFTGSREKLYKHGNSKKN